MRAAPNYRFILWGLGLLGVVAYDLQGLPGQAVTFNIQASESTPDSVLSSVSAAGNLWSSYLQDDVVITLDIDYTPLPTGVLGRTRATETTYDYSTIFQALQSDRSSQRDQTAVDHLNPGSTFDALINYTSDSPLGYGSSIPYLDNDGGRNNRSIRLTTANAKALRIGSADTTASDARITIASQVLWDADRSDGIDGDRYDLIGVATHEIGHALGFISGIDFLDEYSPFSSNGFDFFFPEDSFTTVSTLDLFRFSDASLSAGPSVIDWTANATHKYFSIDGGKTSLAPLATGTTHGDGESASHWSPDQSIGLMNPRLGLGQKLDVSAADLSAFDVIGWDIAPSVVTLGATHEEETPLVEVLPDAVVGPETDSESSVSESIVPGHDNGVLEVSTGISPGEHSGSGLISSPDEGLGDDPSQSLSDGLSDNGSNGSEESLSDSDESYPADSPTIAAADSELPDWVAPAYTIRKADDGLVANDGLSDAEEGSQTVKEVPEPSIVAALWLAFVPLGTGLYRKRFTSR